MARKKKADAAVTDAPPVASKSVGEGGGSLYRITTSLGENDIEARTAQQAVNKTIEQQAAKHGAEPASITVLNIVRNPGQK